MSNAVAHADHALAREQLHELVADQLAPPALQGPHVRLPVVAAQRPHDRGDVGLSRHEIDRDLRLDRPLAHERLAQRDQGGVARVALLDVGPTLSAPVLSTAKQPVP